MADIDITELCDRANVTPRTVHFYVQQGLLPPAGSPGPGARYSQGHVARIRLIRLLQKQHLPLAEIAKRTKGLSDEQVDALVAETKQRRAESKGSALDYIRSVLAGGPERSASTGGPERSASTGGPGRSAPTGGPERSAPTNAESGVPDGAPPGAVPRVNVSRSALALSATANLRMSASPAAASSSPAPARSQWERYTLADGMELHIRRPLSRIEQKQFEKLMAAARVILDDQEGEA